MAVCASSSHSEPDPVAEVSGLRSNKQDSIVYSIVAEVSGLRSNKYDAIVCQIAAEAGDLRYGFAAALLY